MSQTRLRQPLPWAHGRLAPPAVNAADLLDELAARPDARSVPGGGVLRSTMVAGIEFAAVAPGPVDSLRSIWRNRRSGGATPLVVLADAVAPGQVVAIGPSDGAGPAHTVEAEALSQVLGAIAELPRLAAVRRLAADLERLDQAGIPGLRLRKLLTLHTLDTRWRQDPRWARSEEMVKGIKRGSDWRQVLAGLGYTVEQRAHRGRLLRHDGRPVAVVHPKADASEFARFDDQGHPPEGALRADAAAEGVPFAMLAAGSQLRLFDVRPDATGATDAYLELDAATLRKDDLPFLALLGPEALAVDGWFADLQRQARDFGTALRLRLDRRLRQVVFPCLARSFGRWATDSGLDVGHEDVRRDLEQASLTLTFRIMFLLYAESAGFLPTSHPLYGPHSLTHLSAEAAGSADNLTPASTSLWDQLTLLVRAMRTGNDAWGVAHYNGALFSAQGFEGTELLERLTITDPDMAELLIGLGRDAETDTGVDYASLAVGHLGHIYEGLLSLKLTVADRPLVYDDGADTYRAPGANEAPSVAAGELLWQTNEGGRKGGGVYYTPDDLVRHLVSQAVRPAFRAHLSLVATIAETNPSGAAQELFRFAVLDPACGSAHFLVAVIDLLADDVVDFLAEHPLPAVTAELDQLRAGAASGYVIENTTLLHRLVLKRCVFGVDVSPMGAEVAKLSLWLASFVPGLSLAYLDRNVVVGNALIGVARPEALLHNNGEWSLLNDKLAEGLSEAAVAAARLADIDDRTPDEVKASEAANLEVIAATANLTRLCDLWTAEPFGVAGAREHVSLHGDAILGGRADRFTKAANAQASEHHFLHWPLIFPGVFSGERPGFDAVIGNPPWNEVTVERLGFLALFRPGLRSLGDADREGAIAELATERPDLEVRLTDAQDDAATERAALAAGEYESLPGDPDLYKYFCQRYRTLLADGGRLGIVLPRNVFATAGSAAFRRWLFEDTTVTRIDTLLNKRHWAFDAEPRMTVATVATQRAVPPPGHRVEVAGTAGSLSDWKRQVTAAGVCLAPEAFGPNWASPLVRSQAEADLLAKLRHGSPFPFGPGSRWRTFAVGELHETNDKKLWEGADEGLPLWKGESFDQYDPHGQHVRPCPDGPALRAKRAKPRPGSGQLLATELTTAERSHAVVDELGRCRVAFRDVSRATDSRTVRACLVPADVVLTNTAPYLAFANGGDQAQAASLAILNSLPFDWQARRFVETHMNFFVLDGLIVPDLTDESYATVATAAARLSCVDERFASFAEATGVSVGPLGDGEHASLRALIDAHVAHAWNFTEADLDVMFADFTASAVAPEYRDQVRGHLAGLIRS